MKNFYILAFILIATNYGLNAQNVAFGVKAGVNLAQISTPSTEGVKLKTGLNAGVVVEIEISDEFSFQPEILYSSQGIEGDDRDKITNDYINLPLMAKYYIAENFSVEAGPQVGILVSSKAVILGQSVDSKEDFKDIDFGVNFGLGYKLDNGINIAARYNLGLSEVFDFENNDKNQNRVIQVSIGYYFDL